MPIWLKTVLRIIFQPVVRGECHMCGARLVIQPPGSEFSDTECEECFDARQY